MGEYLQNGEGFGDIFEVDTREFIHLFKRDSNGTIPPTQS
jgi:hypothetical protein